MTNTDSYVAAREFARILLPDSQTLHAVQLLLGVVGSIENDGTCTVFLSGEGTAIGGLRKIRGHTPILSTVLVLKNGPNYTIIGSLDTGSNTEEYVEAAVTWSARTTDGDLFSFNVGPYTIDTMMIPSLSLYINPSDAVAWDAAIQVRTAAAGAGTLLGDGGFRNAGLNQRTQVVVPCLPVNVDAGVTQTFYGRVDYNTNTPTTGFVPSALSLNHHITRVVPASL